jgi:HD-GYP domain-containing protein (c-di-GMP phosphodiesterase class II)
MGRSNRVTFTVIGVVGALVGVGGLLLSSSALAAVGIAVCLAAALSAAWWRSPSPPAQPATVSAPPITPEFALARREVVAPVSSEPSDVIQALIDAVKPSGPVLSAHLWLVDSPSLTLRLVVAGGSQRPAPEPVACEGTVLGKAATTGAAVLEQEAKISSPTAENTVWRYAVPLKAGEARGVAAVDVVADEPDRAALMTAFSALHASLSGSLALHVARTESAAARTLLETVRDLARLVDSQSVVELLLERALALAGAQTGSVMLLGEDGTLTIVAAKGLPRDVVRETRVSEGEGIAGWVLATRQSLVVEDLYNKGARARRHGVRSAVAVPIADDDGVVGVLNVGSRSFQARFSQSHRSALEALGRIGAVALRNAWALEASRTLYFDTLRALALALETKDPYSRGTTDRVLEIATALGEELHLEEREQQGLRVAALLHDVGMSTIGDAAVAENRPLTTVEWGMVQMHPVIASDVLAQAPALADAVPIVYHHHEHFDGNGYVLGIAGDHIPLGARVLAVSDAFVALTSQRPYRPAVSQADALAEIEDKSGSQFDPRAVDALKRYLGRNPQGVPKA